jgi:hypothetical protein
MAKTQIAKRRHPDFSKTIPLKIAVSRQELIMMDWIRNSSQNQPLTDPAIKPPTKYLPRTM